MRQQRGVHGIARDRELGGPAHYISSPTGALGRDDRLAPRPRIAKQLAGVAPGADLQKLPSEDILEGFAEQFAFGGKQCASDAVLPPGRQSRFTIRGGGSANWHKKTLAI